MKWYQIDQEQARKEKLRRNELVRSYKSEAKAIRNADPNKRTLLREVKREALARIEDAARTEAQFENVIRLWDDREIVEYWRIAKHEEGYDSELTDKEVSDLGVVIPQPLEHVYWRQLLSGSFLDVIFDCPHEILEMTTSRSILDRIAELDENQLEILYYRAIRQWSPQRIAIFRRQTDRNIRKVYRNMIESIRKELYIQLYPRYIDKLPLTYSQREFCERYWSQLNDTEKARLSRKFEDDERLKRKSKAEV